MMNIQSVGIMSPGDMGHAVGRALGAADLEVIACLKERSERTRSLAASAGICEVADLETLARQADVILSILVPSEAASAAEAMADAIRNTGSSPVFVDCNAIAPSTANQICETITKAGGRFIDGGIIGGPPGPNEITRLYVSGPNDRLLQELDGHGIAVRQLGGQVGRASGIKMCYASLTKGAAALNTAALLTAQSLGLSDELHQELEESQTARLQSMQSIRGLSAKAFRWVGEMEEIAKTYAEAGVTSHFHEGAADVFRTIAESEIGHERPETIDQSRTLAETIRLLARGPRKP